jgi:hypothetical protein
MNRYANVSIDTDAASLPNDLPLTDARTLECFTVENAIESVIHRDKHPSKNRSFKPRS